MTESDPTIIRSALYRKKAAELRVMAALTSAPSDRAELLRTAGLYGDMASLLISTRIDKAGVTTQE